jgi:hypothetical protein
MLEHICALVIYSTLFAIEMACCTFTITMSIMLGCDIDSSAVENKLKILVRSHLSVSRFKKEVDGQASP